MSVYDIVVMDGWCFCDTTWGMRKHAGRPETRGIYLIPDNCVSVSNEAFDGSWWKICWTWHCRPRAICLYLTFLFSQISQSNYLEIVQIHNFMLHRDDSPRKGVFWWLTQKFYWKASPATTFDPKLVNEEQHSRRFTQSTDSTLPSFPICTHGLCCSIKVPNNDTQNFCRTKSEPSIFWTRFDRRIHGDHTVFEFLEWHDV